MYQIVLQNSKGDRLDVTDGRDFETTASGLSPTAANIVTSTVAATDGVRYVSAKRDKRNIVLMIYPLRNIEANRIRLYRFCPTKNQLRVCFKNDERDVYIDGYVESLEADLFASMQAIQLSIICPLPAFIDAHENVTMISNSKPEFYFPFYTLLAHNLVPGGQGLEDTRCELISPISDKSLILNKGLLGIGTLV